MSRPATAIRLTEDEEKALRQHLRSGTTEQRVVERARVILLASQGKSTEDIAETLHTRPARVSKWRQRFAKLRLLGLGDAFRSGKPRQYDESTERRILAQLDESPPAGYASWTGRLLAEALGDVSDDQVWRGGIANDLPSACGYSGCRVSHGFHGPHEPPRSHS